MAYQATHPVEIGSFGRFRYGGKGVVDEWLAIEDLCLEYYNRMWIGFYSAYDVIQWAYEIGLVTHAEYDRWRDRL